MAFGFPPSALAIEFFYSETSLLIAYRSEVGAGPSYTETMKR